MAGAKTSLIFDSEKFSVTTREGLSRQNLATFARDVDLILLEGFKWTNYKKIEVVRRATKREPIDTTDQSPGLCERLVEGRALCKRGGGVFTE